jgi:Fe2+ or Zn2+ uptake regulation protein
VKNILDMMPSRKILNDKNAFTISEIMEKKSLGSTTVYRLLDTLLKENKIEKILVRRGKKILTAYRIKSK